MAKYARNAVAIEWKWKAAANGACVLFQGGNSTKEYAETISETLPQRLPKHLQQNIVWSIFFGAGGMCNRGLADDKHSGFSISVALTTSSFKSCESYALSLQ